MSHRHKPPTRHRRVKIIALFGCLLLTVPLVSYVQALLYPRNASFSVRSVEWIRDHGGGPVVDAIENWVYTRNAPPATGTPHDIPEAAGTPTPSTTRTRTREETGRSSTGRETTTPRTRSDPAPHPIRTLPGLRPFADEGKWTAARRDSHGRSLLWKSWFRPDPAHLTVYVAAALMPRVHDRLTLMPGTREPEPGLKSKLGFSVPAADRGRL